MEEVKGVLTGRGDAENHYNFILNHVKIHRPLQHIIDSSQRMKYTCSS